ncbi:FUSC family protein [Paraburkholderia silvatlantica]|uniref:Membrane protein YccC n=1 Tax=Paraburkholderia silvatlantica TaxID=321895 RepID=A0A2U1AE75_9BURK|nr:FUSC family membrane protein [Paraburkholderia silvatlantica]MBB2928260.1 putative membrane protein YccC [Paraburkholderia silvatlantica]PVY34693.1 putative membrane protein YccC [Paraburkholderia silvatlantica]PXW38908.1 putative membrane protein YccC [Paraburkholderia silvatlantica]PYE22426.1 putative membrane protein YccC [Paraburkholderia silvatlantica]
MRYSVEIRKFLYSQYFYGGLRIAIGISLPAVLCLFVFDKSDLGFTISTGALGACVVDMPGPLKYKRNEMLACSVIGFLSAYATGLATFSPIALWATVVPLTFVLSLIVVYGNRWPQISFATLFMMVMTLEEHFTPHLALVNALWILLGGLWYTAWSTSISQLMLDRIEQQALAESVFACADYLLARAQFFDLDNDLDECYRNLVAKQIAAVERQDAARDIVLRNLPRLRAGKIDARRAMHFNLFINTVDLHELFVGAHTDYPLVRNTFGGSDLLVFYRDLIRKAAADLEDIGLAVLQNEAPRASVNVKAELRAIEYELEQLKKRDLASTDPEAYAAISASFRRIWSATRLIDRMRRSLASEVPTTETELRIDEALTRFVTNRRVSWLQIFSNLTMASPSFRHALRVTIAVAVGFWLGRLLPLTNAYWIVMTSIIILKPGYSLTRQRNAQRIVGTLIGCLASIALILLVKQPLVLLVSMFAAMVMSYSLLLFNYTASVVFTSAYVLLMFHLLAPGSMRIIGERAIDTVVGCMIAIGASHLFPYWEYRLMGKLVHDMIAATRSYLEASWWWSGRASAPQPAFAGAAASEAGARVAAHAAPAATLAADAGGVANPVPGSVSAMASASANAASIIDEPVAAAATLDDSPTAGAPGSPVAAVGTKAAAQTAQAAAGAAAAAPSLARDFRYRLARKNVHVAFANLGQAFQRMMLEPKAAQKFVPELNDLLVRSHVLASQITATAPLLRSTARPDQPEVKLDALQRALSCVRENLVAAEAGTPAPADQTDITKQLTRELDAMVVQAERALGPAAELPQELKLLAHQCKQMITASWLIRRDASIIRLPEE